jgi:hypothetical protein
MPVTPSANMVNINSAWMRMVVAHAGKRDSPQTADLARRLAIFRNATCVAEVQSIEAGQLCLQAERRD